MPTIKILIADDHHLIAESLSMLLVTVDKFEILGVVKAMFPYEIISVSHEEENLKYTMFKVILNDVASGYFVKSEKIEEKNVFVESFKQEINTFDQQSYNEFITDGGYTYKTFVCSTSRVSC